MPSIAARCSRELRTRRHSAPPAPISTTVHFIPAWWGPLPYLLRQRNHSPPHHQRLLLRPLPTCRRKYKRFFFAFNSYSFSSNSVLERISRNNTLTPFHRQSVSSGLAIKRRCPMLASTLAYREQNCTSM